MPEFVLDSRPDKQVFIRPDEKGFTTRTRFLDTQHVLAVNSRRKSLVPKPRVTGPNGVTYRHVGSIPAEVMHLWIREWGKMRKPGEGLWPSTEFMMKKLRDRDWMKLRTTEEKF